MVIDVDEIMHHHLHLPPEVAQVAVGHHPLQPEVAHLLLLAEMFLHPLVGALQVVGPHHHHHHLLLVAHLPLLEAHHHLLRLLVQLRGIKRQRRVAVDVVTS